MHDSHHLFTLGPILFCRRCGAVKSVSSGHSISRPCRGWAPKGTQILVKSLLKGKPASRFYLKILRDSATPVKRLLSKTKPTLNIQAPHYDVAHQATLDA